MEWCMSKRFHSFVLSFLAFSFFSLSIFFVSNWHQFPVAFSFSFLVVFYVGRKAFPVPTYAYDDKMCVPCYVFCLGKCKSDVSPYLFFPVVR
uniref:Uncharacterized protein n=1 Tax=Anopheles darlingi TaxID=43151 RepID=A0A2M4DQY6_ANODA